MSLQAADTGRGPGVRLRIALLGYRSNPYSGGQGIYLKYLSRALADLGHRVDVISGEPYPDLDPDVSLIKLPGLNLFEQDNHVTALRPRHLLSATDSFEWFSMLTGGFPEPYTFGRRLLKHLRRHHGNYDIVHDNQSLSHALLQLQNGGQYSPSLVTTIHHPITWDRDIALNHARDRSERLLIRRWHHFLRMQTRVARQLQHVVTVSERSKTDICDAFGIAPERVTVVHNGIDSDAFAPQPGVRRAPARLISTASADQPLKGTQHLIPALAKVKRSHPDVELVMIGRPKPGGRTEQLIQNMNLGDTIRFVHGLTTEEIVQLYAESTVAVVPSEYEGFGLPAGEAMASGVPVVSTDGGALPEVVGDAGIVVPARDPGALADAIVKLLDNEPLRARLAHAGRRRIVNHFSWAQAAVNVSDLYASILAP